MLLYGLLKNGLTGAKMDDPSLILYLFHLLHPHRETKLVSKNGNVLFEDPESSIVSLPPVPPMPEPLHSWYESAQVKETLQGFQETLRKKWSSTTTAAATVAGKS